MTLTQIIGYLIVCFFFTYCRAGGGPHIEPQYRQYPQITKKQKFESELISGAMWFWILWHCWHDPDAVLVSKHAVYTERGSLMPGDVGMWGCQESDSSCESIRLLGGSSPTASISK